MSKSKELKCSSCNSKRVQEVVFIENVPAHCNVLWNDREKAIDCPKGDILLNFCMECGHLYNQSFNHSLMTYTEEYENTLDFSPAFQKYSKALVEDLTKKYQLSGKNIVEIGCGKGDFLKMICNRGNNHGYGFDKSYDPSLEQKALDESVTFIQDFYSEKYAHYPADMIISRHVLEHIESPELFLAEIKKNVGTMGNKVFYIEVPNILYTLRDLGIWDLIYEHCSYFSAPSIYTLFNNLGFSIYNVEERYHNQFLSIEAGLESSTDQFHLDINTEDVKKLVDKFASAFKEKVGYWEKKLAELRAKNKTIVVWGGGSKGVSFLNFLKTTQAIHHIVDINPRKSGKFVAGTGQEYVQPHRLAELQPDTVIIMNPIYKNEISQSLSELNLSPEILVA